MEEDEEYQDELSGGTDAEDADVQWDSDYDSVAPASGGLSYLGMPGVENAMARLVNSNEQARAALQQAREKIAARKYNSAIGLLAVSGALLSPTRSGGFGESLGNAANAMIGPLQAKDTFEQTRDKELLGIDTSIAGLDQGTAKAELDLAKLRAQLDAKAAMAPNDRVYDPVTGDVVLRARQEARKPGYKAWTPAGTKFDLGQREETEEAKAVGRYFGEQFAKLQESGLAADEAISKLDRVDQLMGEEETSKLTPLWTDLAGIAEAFKIKLDPKLGNKQAADALMKEMALQLRDPRSGGGMPGSLSNDDRKYLEKMGPGLAQSKEGRRQIIHTARKLKQRQKDVARMARAYRKKNGKMDEGFLDEVEAWAEKNHLFAEEMAAAKEAEKAGAELSAARQDLASLADTGVPPLLRRAPPSDVAPPPGSNVPAIPSEDEAPARPPGVKSFYDYASGR